VALEGWVGPIIFGLSWIRVCFGPPSETVLQAIELTSTQMQITHGNNACVHAE
jgi:hypothetical protein